MRPHYVVWISLFALLGFSVVVRAVLDACKKTSERWPPMVPPTTTRLKYWVVRIVGINAYVMQAVAVFALHAGAQIQIALSVYNAIVAFWPWACNSTIQKAIVVAGMVPLLFALAFALNTTTGLLVVVAVAALSGTLVDGWLYLSSVAE